MPKRPKGEGGFPPKKPEPGTDPSKTGVSETDVGEITQDIEEVSDSGLKTIGPDSTEAAIRAPEVEVDETLVSIAPKAKRTSVGRPKTGELSELDLADEGEEGKPDELPVHPLNEAERRALFEAGAEDGGDQTDPGLKRQTVDRDIYNEQRRIAFQNLWDELATLAGKEIERKEFARFQERQKAGEDVDVLLRELWQIVDQRRKLAAAADLPADRVVGQGNDTLDGRTPPPAAEAEEETLDPGATHVVRPRKTPRRPESTEIIPPKPKPKKNWWKFWKK